MHLISNSIGFKIVVTFILITFCSIYSARSDELKLICEGKLESLRFGQVESFEMELTFLTVKGSKLLDYEIYASNAYLMDKGFSTKNLSKLLEKIDSDKNFNPTSIIAFGYHFDSKNLREISENIKSYANKKNIDIDFITRY